MPAPSHLRLGRHPASLAYAGDARHRSNVGRSLRPLHASRPAGGLRSCRAKPLFHRLGRDRIQVGAQRPTDSDRRPIPGASTHVASRPATCAFARPATSSFRPGWPRPGCRASCCLAETGKPLMQHTYEAAQRASRPSGVCVAADHEEIAAAVRGFRRRSADDQPRLRQRHRSRGRGRPAARPTSTSSSTCKETSRNWPATSIDRVIELLEENPDVVDVDAGHADSQPRSARRSGLRQGGVRRRAAGRCISAAARFRTPASGTTSCWPPIRRTFYQHVGLYAYRRDFLLRLAELAAHAAGEARKAGATARAGSRLSRSPSAWSTSRPWASTRPRITGRLSAARSGGKMRFQGCSEPWPRLAAIASRVSGSPDSGSASGLLGGLPAFGRAS